MNATPSYAFLIIVALLALGLLAVVIAAARSRAQPGKPLDTSDAGETAGGPVFYPGDASENPRPDPAASAAAATVEPDPSYHSTIAHAQAAPLEAHTPTSGAADASAHVHREAPYTAGGDIGTTGSGEAPSTPDAPSPDQP